MKTRTEAPPISEGSISTVTGSTFGPLVMEAAGPIVVEFMSYGCVHCRTLEPVLEQVAASLKGSEVILRVNVAVDSELAGSYGVDATPTLVMFLDGREVRRILGCASCGSTNAVAHSVQRAIGWLSSGLRADRSAVISRFASMRAHTLHRHAIGTR